MCERVYQEPSFVFSTFTRLVMIRPPYRFDEIPTKEHVKTILFGTSSDPFSWRKVARSDVTLFLQEAYGNETNHSF